MTTDKSIEARFAEWVLGRHTGTSSKAIARVMLGIAPDPWGCDHPSDGGDLGRCIRLLDLIPEWRARLPEMAAYSTMWAVLVEHWDSLEADHRAGKAVYERMRALLRPVEDATGRYIRLGAHAAITTPPKETPDDH